MNYPYISVNKILVSGILLYLVIYGAYTFGQSPPQIPYWDHKLIEVRPYNDSQSSLIAEEPYLYIEGWDTLPQIQFWNKIIQMNPDSALISKAKNREIIGHTFTPLYDSLSKEGKEQFKDSIKQFLQIPKDELIYVTGGKNYYYRITDVLPEISDALPIFAREGVDPWYAQVILLIESPARIRRSAVGAYGPFQLMKGVAKDMGLVVDGIKDERIHFDKAATAAARFIQRVCIPKTRQLLQRNRISFQEQSLWFRLLVLHMYHAGPRTIERLFPQLNLKKGGESIIRQMWTVSYRKFGNASQNYSQIALALLLTLDRIIAEEFEYVCR